MTLSTDEILDHPADELSVRGRPQSLPAMREAAALADLRDPAVMVNSTGRARATSSQSGRGPECGTILGAASRACAGRDRRSVVGAALA
ncbi:hypothetical protein S58_14750 [Bradyrhizobium oligotrophicum S58]|uniref:Uncharacterized protein n=1 Tax=Bradyrhizobium oligotrophicum S58 TaxID=1245469 RepID=M4Z2L7_9BRAD|nr:hypothetical protein S58_14750 [Bradyrhizobium oligotrophicum S58]